MRADVQLEHGFIRVANRLAEAILQAELSPIQFRIMHALIRLTYGWGRKTVTVSHSELATYCHTSATGPFRQALRDLITNGAVLLLEPGTGRTKSTLAIQKDFTKWGRYQTGPDRLASIFGRRPESDDSLMRQSDLFTDAGSQGASEQSGRVTASSQPAYPEADTGTGSKSFDDETVAPRKDSERHGKTVEQRAEGATTIAEAAFRSAMGAAVERVDEFLASRPVESRPKWYPELLSIIGPATGILPDDLAGACSDALIEQATSPVAIRAFASRRKVERIRSSIPTTTPTSSASPAPTRALAEHAADDAVWDTVISVVARFRRNEMTLDAFEALPWPLRYALRIAGGWRAIHEAKPGSLPFVRRDFLKSYHSAPSEPVTARASA